MEKYKYMLRDKRALRLEPPEEHPFSTSDGMDLLFTRYRGGTKGPVILVHGLGVSSLIFAIDTIECNLVEYLAGRGYDVWLLDFRASISLPSASQSWNADEIALHDYPAAIAYVCAFTGANSVQVVAHCFGAMTFVMAMLAGLQGVRSAVCSQVAAHLVAPPLTQFKAITHMPGVLDALGVHGLSADPDDHLYQMEELFDQALKLYPIQLEERCESAVCRRVTFLFGQLYEHDQLNSSTHNVLHEMFGMVNSRVGEHLAAIVRNGYVVDEHGNDRYIPHAERLAIPLLIIHGAENGCWLPHSTDLTYRWLRSHNNPALYSRQIIPNYGHLDCIFGKNAVDDVYPFILQHLESS